MTMSPRDEAPSALTQPAVSLDQQSAALRVAHRVMVGWREQSASSKAAHAFVEEQRKIPAAVWKEMIPCGVLPVAGSEDHDRSRLLTLALAQTQRDPRVAAALLESAHQAGLLLRRDAEIHTLGRQQYGTQWRSMSGVDKSAALTAMLTARVVAGKAPTDLYSDYPVIVQDRPDGSTQRRYGHWLAVPMMAIHPATGVPTLAGFAFRSLRPLEETGQDYRHRTTRRNGFSDGRSLIMGLADFGPDIQRRQAAVLVEGTMDYLAACAAYRADPRRALPPLAVQGADMSPHELDTLAAAAPRLVSLLDFDTGGRRATEQVGAALLARGTATYVGTLDGLPLDDEQRARVKDPSDVVTVLGAPGLVALEVQAQRMPLPRYQIAVRLAALSADSATWTRRNQFRALEQVAPTVAAWPEGPAAFIGEAAAAFCVDASTVELELARHAGPVRRDVRTIPTPSPVAVTPHVPPQVTRQDPPHIPQSPPKASTASGRPASSAPVDEARLPSRRMGRPTPPRAG